MTDARAPWWQTGVLYQVYPRSFADANGDGIGDLQGVIDHLDHLAWLGVDAVWLSPVTVSPNVDWGYDVADYRDIDPDYGTLETLDRLVTEASAHGIRILMDLVPNHTSDQHPWFVAARAGRDAPTRDYYVWADPKPDGSPPNNWISTFGGPAWEWDAASGQYFLHNFEVEQPDLNWWSEDVRREFEEILAFWWDRGVAGFRIDVCHAMIKDKELRDNPPAGPDDPFVQQVFGQQWKYNCERPETHDILRRWRQLADAARPPRLLLGETSVDTLDKLATYYGDGTDELHLAFNFVMLDTPFTAEALRATIEGTEAVLPDGAWPVWAGSNHDVPRLASHWGDGDPARIRAALVMLLTLRGTPVLYQGDEIGLVDGEVPKERMLDRVGLRFWPHYAGRDPERTPMPWAPVPGGGFTAPGVEPWLPMTDPTANSVAAQADDRGSVLWLVHDLIALRRRTPDLQLAPYRTRPAPDGVFAYDRGAVTVALNLSDGPRRVEVRNGTIALGTHRGREGEAVAGTVELAPAEAVIVAPETG